MIRGPTFVPSLEDPEQVAGYHGIGEITVARRSNSVI